MEFYAVYIPPKPDTGDNESSRNVFAVKHDAFQLLKRHKDARFKAFKSQKEALRFATEGPTPVNITGLKSPSSLPPIPAERSMHKSLTPQELIAFRKEIEQNHLSDVYQMVMENPRYLVNTAANMPTIVKEGPRYNALHAAIVSKHFNMCKLILQTIEKPQFIVRLYGLQDEQTTCEASEILLESYLNMPNKPRQETPLHFAAKLGLVEITQLLLSYPLCKQKLNSEGQYPKDVVCQRCPDATPELQKTIENLLQEQFFVPVIRAKDNSLPPSIGEPFCGPNIPDIEAASHLSPQMEVVAVAGPMDKEQAQNFRRRWKTPPRLGVVKSPCQSPQRFQGANPFPTTPHPHHENNNILASPTTTSTPTTTAISRRRLFHAMDQNGNTPEDQSQLPPFAAPATKFFREYRDDNFQDSFASDVSLDSIDSPAAKEMNIRLRDPQKGIETVGRELAKSACVGWKEHWKFLGEFVDLSSTEGLELFENYLKNQEDDPMKSSTNEQMISALVDVFNTLHLKEPHTPRSKSMDTLKSYAATDPTTTTVNNHQHHQNPDVLSNITNPNLSIEKALQVYAKRASFNISRTTATTEALDAELKKLNTIVLSYCEDTRFLSVNFRRAHARYARLIHYYLENGNVIDGMKAHTQNPEVNCVILHLLRMHEGSVHENPNLITTEQDCIEAWSREPECECTFWRAERSRVKSRRRDFRLSFHQQKQEDELLWSHREPNLNCSVESDESQDEYFSCDSDLEQFSDAQTDDTASTYGTPPESPVDFASVYAESEDGAEDSVEDFTFNNYIDGPLPTKTDTNVLNAIQSVQLDENSYPHIAKWKKAMEHFTPVERECFPVKLPPLQIPRSKHHKQTYKLDSIYGTQNIAEKF